MNTRLTIPGEALVQNIRIYSGLSKCESAKRHFQQVPSKNICTHHRIEVYYVQNEELYLGALSPLSRLKFTDEVSLTIVRSWSGEVETKSC